MSRWAAHGACLAVLAVQVALWGLGHRDDDSLRAALSSSRAPERIEARWLLLERGAVDPEATRASLAQELLASDVPLEVDFAHTTAVCKHTGAEVQYGHLKELMAASQVDADFWRQFVLLRRKIGVVVGGSSGRLDRRELGWWFDALAGRPLPAEEVLAHIRASP